MFELTSSNSYTEPFVFIDGHDVVKKFPHFSCTINHYCSLDDDEIALRILKATDVFTLLKDRVWSRTGIRKEARVSVYNACILTDILYSCKTWVF